jgi:hypothetical protein
MAAFEVAQSVGGDDIKGTLSSSAATITMGGTSGDARISQDYDHLWLTFSNKVNRSEYYQYCLIEFNGDNDYDYTYTSLYSNSVTAWGGTSTVYTYRETSSIRGIKGDYCAARLESAGYFGNVQMWIPNYSNTSYFKSTISGSEISFNSDTSGRFWVSRTAGLYKDSGTAGITQIKIKPGSLGGEFQPYTSYVLYGITGV